MKNFILRALYPSSLFFPQKSGVGGLGLLVEESYL